MKVYNVVMQKTDGQMVQYGIKASSLEVAISRAKQELPGADVISGGFAAKIDLEATE